MCISNYITRCFGITKDSESNNFIIVMEYAKNGSLRKHLNNSFNSMKWKDKLDILKRLQMDLMRFIEMD
jgi:hypothetical protein